MNDDAIATATECLNAAESGSMTFPQIVGRLIKAGFESYEINFRRSTATYFVPDGDCVELPIPPIEQPVSAQFDSASVQAAIKEAQKLVPGYTYRGFCEKVTKAGCAGYLVSFLGRRVLYVGRTGETHTEYFPN